MDAMVAKKFGAREETDDMDEVLLKITVENKRGKYFICLDNREYTLYPDEKEILL